MRRASSTWGFESLRLRSGIPTYGAWLSPVERCVRVAEVPGSNPGAPIINREERGPRAPLFATGRVAEWLKAHDWKSCGRQPAWVRIPPRPLSVSQLTGGGSNLFEPEAAAPGGAGAGDYRGAAEPPAGPSHPVRLGLMVTLDSM